MSPVHLGEVRFVPRPAPREEAPVTGMADPSVIAAGEPNRAPAGQPKAGAAPRPLFMPRSSSVPERATTQRRSLTGDITSIRLSEVDTAVDLFGRLVTSRTRISRRVQDLQRPATESARNGQRLRGIIDKLAVEFEIVRRERRAASHREGWDALELETFDTYAQIMLELGEIISDQEEIAGTLGEGVRRTSMICESDLETTNDLQRSLLGFRLVRINTIEPRLDQVITATARAVGRHIEWKLRGGSTAVDKTVLDALQEPLLHLLRNAIDHGIESPEVREARGKPALGTIGVEASYGTNSLIIRVSDDGGGIDPENIAAIAVRRGLLTADAVRALDARAKLDLIWQPGFSTANTVTDISGRGVGLDIVRGAIGRVRGTIALESAVGQGTTFVLTLPLSLSVVRTLALRDGSATVAAPISQIEGIHLVRTENIARLPDRSVALVDGRTITLLPQGLAQPLSLEERLGGESVVVVEVRLSAERTVGFLIDEVLGEEDTLVKALPRYLQHRAAFVGCSVSDSGRPYAIVDLRRLAEESGTARIGSVSAPASPLGFSGITVAGPAPLALVVDDSLFMRRSLSDVFVLGGFRVETAEDGEAALSVIARVGMPDLITLDMEMPRMNGLEMLSILRQLPGGRQVPVFMITTRGQERHRKAALAAGVSRYFIKPFDGDDVLAA
ncbi:MAG TPA: response regulator, partial [Chloroflexota bacterium]